MIFSGQLYKFKAKESEEGELLCGPELHAGEQMSTVLFQVEMIVGVVITYGIPLIIMTVVPYSLVAFHL